MTIRALISAMLLLALVPGSSWAADTLYDSRFQQWQEAASAGDPEAQYKLGNSYLRGIETGRDPAKALAWYLKAAAQGHVKSKFKVGYLYFTGEGVKQDHGEAFRWLREAAEAGYSPAQFFLATLYAEGKGVKQDLETALDWFVKAAEDGYSPAEGEIARIRLELARRAKEEAARAAARRAASQSPPAATPQPQPPSPPPAKAAPTADQWFDRLIGRNWHATDLKGTGLLPSRVVRCSQAGKALECESQRLERFTAYAEVNYKVRSQISHMDDTGRFRVHYTITNLFVLPDDPDDPTPRSSEELPAMGDQPPVDLECRFVNPTRIECGAKESGILVFIGND